MQLFYQEILACLEKDGGMLVSVVSETGSAPRGVGAKMLVRLDGSIAGTIGGGAVEHISRTMAAEALTRKRSFLHQFFLSPDQLSDLGMICGGEIDVYFQYMPPNDADITNLFRHIVTCIEANQPCSLITVIAGDDCTCYLAAQDSPAPPQGEAAGLSTERLRAEVAGEVRYVVEPVVAGERALIFGAGHVGRALTEVLNWLEFYTVALDDREEFLLQSYIPAAHERRLVDLTESVATLKVTPRDFIVIMTRGHLHDYTVLRQALGTSARYIGVIGSRTKIAATYERLRREGFVQEDIDRIHAPIGIPMGGKTPEEVAFSVAAQLTRIRNNYTEK